MQWMRERLRQEEGFTLIELMVVVLIIAVLVAIAVPSFIGFRSRAQDRAAQAELRNVLIAEKGYWLDNSKFTNNQTALKAFEPTIQVTTTAVGRLTSASPVGVYLSVRRNDDAVCMVKVADSGNTFAIFDDESTSGGTYYQWWTSKGTPACPTTAGTAPKGWSARGWPKTPKA